MVVRWRSAINPIDGWQLFFSSLSVENRLNAKQWHRGGWMYRVCTLPEGITEAHAEG